LKAVLKRAAFFVYIRFSA